MRLVTRLEKAVRRLSFSRVNAALAVMATLVWGVSIGALVARNSSDVEAVKATDFNYGRIIDDAVFYNKNAMTVAEIDAVLRKYSPSCDTWGTKTQTDSSAAQFKGWTRAQYAAHMVSQGSTFYHAPPYICIADYREDMTTGKTTFDDASWKGGKSVAEMIYDAGQQYNINPQVLLVTLRKESRLFTDDWPVRNQYIYAMGYGCPDSGPGYSANCDPKYAGFATQMESAAWQLNRYRENITAYRYQPGRTVSIQYAPEPSCGSRSVYIENVATASLYIYTPYVPNTAALANYPGTASCGAYGNRNFFMYFNEWFGSTYTKNTTFVPMDVPRWLRLKDDTQKIDASTGVRLVDILPKHMQRRFVDKILVDNRWLLRTEWDASLGNLQGIPQDELEEIPYEPIEPTWMVLLEDGNKSVPHQRSYASSLARGTAVHVVDKVIIDENTYYRTKEDSLADNCLGIIERQLTEFTPISLDDPRYFHATRDTWLIDPRTGEKGGEIKKDTTLFIPSKVLVGGVWYFRTENESPKAYISSSDLENGGKVNTFGSFTLRLSKPVCKVDFNRAVTGACLETGRDVVMGGTVQIGGASYYVTTHDISVGNFMGIKISDLFVPLDVPREFILKVAVPKTDLETMKTLGTALEKGRKISFSTKIMINGSWWLRTEHDTGNNTLQAMKIDYLE